MHPVGLKPSAVGSGALASDHGFTFHLLPHTACPLALLARKNMF
jgi:hypothetical protein